MLRHLLTKLACIAFACLSLSVAVHGADPAPAPAPLKVLFLGDKGHHRPADRAAQLMPVLRSRGIAVEYTENFDALSSETLSQFDGLILYANQTEITPAQETALIEYVQSGRGFIPLHCASFCFLNSERFIAMVGGQFQRHGGEVFGTQIAEPNHPIMKGYSGFRSWDETYIHHKHNEQGRTVLEYRVQGEQAPNQKREPWTWVREEGKGRVFYTAWGHDERTWSNPGFVSLVERGIRWACKQDISGLAPYVDNSLFQAPEFTEARTDVEPFGYVEVGNKIPNYTPSDKWGVQGDPLTKMQTPLSPAESLKHYIIPKGFELKLFASEPQLGGKPIFMTWDERGRLWTCETIDYPNELKPENKGRDRIRICEDTDGDGAADKFTIFAEDLSIPTSLAFFQGGVLVQNGTETLYLKDVDGDDKADVREIAISGWGMGDTHGGISNFQYGLDNWYWGMQGYNDSEPVIATGKQPGFRQGFWRFHAAQKPGPIAVDQLEFIRSTNNNTWGLGFSEDGLVFGSTANRNPSVFMPIANRYYERVRGWSPELLGTIADTHLFNAVTDKIRQVDQHGGYTAAAGHALYTARAYPATWWNKTAFVAEPTGHLVGTFVLTRDGAGYQSTSPCNLVASDDEWASPIMAEVGPDGHVWVLDWYNYIIQHNPTPNGFKTGKGNAYESDLRDKRYGRIYRLVYSGAAEQDTTVLKLSKDDPAGLVSALKNSNLLWRKHAQRLLVERQQPDVAPALISLVKDTTVDAIGLNVGAIHALWTLHGLGLVAPNQPEVMNAVFAALKHPSAAVRRNALQVLPAAPEACEAIVQSNLIADEDAQVRLAAFLAIADQNPTTSAGVTLSQALFNEGVLKDRWLADALTSAAATHSVDLIAALAQQQEKQPRDGQGASSAKRNVIVRIVAEHMARSRMDEGSFAKIVNALPAQSPELRESILDGLAAGWPSDYRLELAAATDESLLGLLKSVPANSKGKLIQLASRIGSQRLSEQAREITVSMLSVAEDANQSAASRVEAGKQAIAISATDSEVVGKLMESISPQSEPELAIGLIEAISSSRAPDASKQLVGRFASFTPAAREAVVRALLARGEWTADLIEQMKEGKIQLSELKLEQKQALLAHPNRKIRDAATALMKSGGGLPSADRQRVLEQYHSVTTKSGNAGLGKAVFTKHCAVCHQYNGEGQAIGPDLTGMSVHPKEELLTHILDPSRSVEGNFRTYTIQTTEGLVLTGMLASESRTSVEIVDTQGKRQTLQRADIEQLVGSSKSLMPEGFESQIKEDELTNLLEFLTSKGRFVPLSLAKVATAVSTQSLFHEGPPTGPDRMVFRDWSPKKFKDVPFVLVNPQGDRVPNLILLNGPNGSLPPQMPKSVTIPCNVNLKKLHFLSGVSGWGYPFSDNESVSMIVRLTYVDGTTEEFPLKNGVHFADYIRRVDVPGSEFAFSLNGQQLRYFELQPKGTQPVKQLELIKGNDDSAPMVMAITAETDAK